MRICIDEKQPYPQALISRNLHARAAQCRRCAFPKRGFRSPEHTLAAARAGRLGSAKSRVEHWLAARVSAVALVPLTLWFVASIIAHSGSDHAAFLAWLIAPVPALLMILLLIALFYHTALGLQVVIEDYVHSGAKFAVMLLLRLSCFVLAVAGIFAPLRIVFAAKRVRKQRRQHSLKRRDGLIKMSKPQETYRCS